MVDETLCAAAAMLFYGRRRDFRARGILPRSAGPRPALPVEANTLRLGVNGLCPRGIGRAVAKLFSQ
jgi:hypothetical protein